MATEIISRAEARARGFKQYFDGKTCKRGHCVNRYTNDGSCSECKRLHIAARYRGGSLEPVRGKNERSIARASGQKTYRTEKPCSNGHIAERTTIAAQCVVCSEQIKTRWASNNKVKIKLINQKYFQNNKEACVRRSTDWFEKNRDRFRIHMRNEYQKDPERFLVHGRTRRARKLASGGEHTAEDIKYLFKLQRGKCAYCKVRLNKYHVDHILAIARGGSNDRKNLQLLCPPCNQKKSAKDSIDFAQQMGFLL